MEDQPTDPGDLTAEAVVATVPTGKAARNRHRLPRQKASGSGAGVEVARDDAENAAEAPEGEPGTDSAEPESSETSTVVPAEDADVEPPTVLPVKRRRSLWGRKKNTVVIPDETVDATPAVTEDVAEPTASEGAESEDGAPQPDPDPVMVPHQRAGRALKYAAVSAGALFIAAGAFAGATLQPYLADRAAVHTKFAIAETAAHAITTLWTYTPDDMAKLPNRSAQYLGGDFAVDYQRYIDSIVEPNKQAQISNQTQVLGVAVESVSPADASALVYTNSVSTSPVTKGIPSLRYLSYRLNLEQRNRHWLITKMTAVTSLDLTPRL
ncbi:MAG: mammalian cell entry protein [Actinomycetota bacterium]|nr:mammalian cell entry protein [Actinomycetota bacterium]